MGINSIHTLELFGGSGDDGKRTNGKLNCVNWI